MGTNVIGFAVSGRNAGLIGRLVHELDELDSAPARIVTRMVTSWRGRW
jgi:hypothetical protein